MKISHDKTFPRHANTTRLHAVIAARDVQTEDSCLYSYWTFLTGIMLSKHNIEIKKFKIKFEDISEVHKSIPRKLIVFYVTIRFF